MLVAWSVWTSRGSFPRGYDPYEVLGLASVPAVALPTLGCIGQRNPSTIQAAESEIVFCFSKYSHPDKVPNEQKAEAEAKFIEISRAYKV